MPLVIVVLVIIVVLMNAVSSNKAFNKAQKYKAEYYRNTNAELEQIMLDNYLKQGYTMREAYDMASKDIIALGYERCVPISAYGHRIPKDSESKGYYSSIVKGGATKYDSEYMQERRSTVIDEWKIHHPDETISEEELRERTYRNLPKTQIGMEADMKRQISIVGTIPLGGCFVHPKYGTCEIIGHKDVGKPCAAYRAKVLRTDEIVLISVNDKSITEI